jgi:hypothetical protein
VSKLNGSKPPDPLDDLDEVIAELEGNDWEVISEVHEQTFVFPERARTTVETDKATGRTKVVSIPDEEVTRNDHPKPESRWPERAGDVATRLIAAVDRPERLAALALLLALAAFAAWLRWGR